MSTIAAVVLALVTVVYGWPRFWKTIRPYQRASVQVKKMYVAKQEQVTCFSAMMLGEACQEGDSTLVRVPYVDATVEVSNRTPRRLTTVSDFKLIVRMVETGKNGRSKKFSSLKAEYAANAKQNDFTAEVNLEAEAGGVPESQSLRFYFEPVPEFRKMWRDASTGLQPLRVECLDDKGKQAGTQV